MTPSSTQKSALAQLSARTTLPLVSQGAIGLAYLVLLWSQRQRTRRDLRDLSDHLLRDVGLSREDALRESRKTFWRL